MLMKTKMALAVMSSLIAGGIGLAAAQGITTPQPDQTADVGNAGNGGGFRQRMLQKYDTNGDGQLDAQERAAMRADFKAKREARRAKMLAKWDLNGDGKLEPNERAAMREAHAEKAFKRLDTNGDGQLSLQEFEQARMFQGHRFMRGGFGGGGGGTNGGQP